MRHSQRLATITYECETLDGQCKFVVALDDPLCGNIQKASSCARLACVMFVDRNNISRFTYPIRVTTVSR